jgi:hypothetical protein
MTLNTIPQSQKDSAVFIVSLSKCSANQSLTPANLLHVPFPTQASIEHFLMVNVESIHQSVTVSIHNSPTIYFPLTIHEVWSVLLDTIDIYQVWLDAVLWMDALLSDLDDRCAHVCQNLLLITWGSTAPGSHAGVLAMAHFMGEQWLSDDEMAQQVILL